MLDGQGWVGGGGISHFLDEWPFHGPKGKPYGVHK